MTRRIICLMLLLITFMCYAQRTTRPKLKLKDTASEAVEAADTLYADSLISCLKISGYEKTLRATTESMFITNNGNRPIDGVNITINYFDMQDRQLHQRNLSITVYVPAGETRMAKIKSWDNQKVWYYYLSDRTRTKLQSTPYKVKIDVNYAISRD